MVINSLQDILAERMVMSALINNGADCFYDIANIVNENDFSKIENKILFSTIKNLYQEKSLKELDIISIITQVHSIDKEAVKKYKLADYISALQSDKVLSSSAEAFAKRIAKLNLTKTLIVKMSHGIENLKRISGDESLLDIIALAENPLSDFSSNLISEQDTVNLCDSLADYVEYLIAEQPQVQGVASGFPIYDKLIGGGLIAPGVHIIAGRAGSGKSFTYLNIANYVTKCGIPVLYLDTELTANITQNRWLSLLTDIPSDIIKTGAFANNEMTAQRVRKIAAEANRPYYYHNISGMHHTEWISIARRWLLRKVGVDEYGMIKPCLVVLDYIKLMNLEDSDHQEYQYIGQILTDLHNFCIKYNLPILAGCQLNREGIDREDQGTLSASDRINWLASSVTLLKNKTDVDYASSPVTDGNKKFVIVKSRFGPGTGDGEYINLKCDLARSLIIEGETNLNVRKNKKGELKLDGKEPIVC